MIIIKKKGSITLDFENLFNLENTDDLDNPELIEKTR